MLYPGSESAAYSNYHHDLNQGNASSSNRLPDYDDEQSQHKKYQLTLL